MVDGEDRIRYCIVKIFGAHLKKNVSTQPVRRSQCISPRGSSVVVELVIRCLDGFPLPLLLGMSLHSIIHGLLLLLLQLATQLATELAFCRFLSCLGSLGSFPPRIRGVCSRCPAAACA